MFLIIEGIHDTGKTSLIESIRSNLFFSVFQSKRLFPELANIRNISISDFATGNNCAVSWFATEFADTIDVAFDRFHLSEYAYSRLFRDVEFTIAMTRFRIIDDKICTTNTRMIYLHSDYETIAARCKSKNESYTANDHARLTEYFDEVVKETKIKCCKIDTGKNNTDETFRIANDFIRSA
jgi:thymidylate kinase